MSDWDTFCCVTLVTHWVNELHGLCKLGYALQRREHSAGLYSQELAGGDRKLWWRSRRNLRVPPGRPFFLLLCAAAACGQRFIWHAVGPGGVLLQTLEEQNEKTAVSTNLKLFFKFASVLKSSIKNTRKVGTHNTWGQFSPIQSLTVKNDIWMD